MEKMLVNNWGLKLSAVFIAFLLWIVVVNVSDPEIVQTFSNIEVKIQNEQIMTNSDLYYEVQKGNRATVVLKGPRSVISNITAKDISAVADLQNLSSTNSVEIEYDITYAGSSKVKQVEIVEKTIAMWLHVEDIITKSYSVDVLLTGNPEQNYVVDGYFTDTKELKVTAPESVHRLIHHIGLPIDISKATKDVETEVAPCLIAESGSVIAGSRMTTIEAESVPVYVGIAYTKEVPIQYSIEGTPAYGYEFIASTINKQNVCLIGSKEDLDAITAVQIPSEDTPIEGVTESSVFELNLSRYIPNGITFYNRAKNQKYSSEIVVVNAEIEAWVSKTFALEKANILLSNTPKNCSVDFTNDNSVIVEVRGLEKWFEDFDFSKDVRAVLNCEGVTTSTEYILLQLELSKEGLVIEEDIYIDVTVQDLSEVNAPQEEARIVDSGSEQETNSDLEN